MFDVQIFSHICVPEVQKRPDGPFCIVFSNVQAVKVVVEPWSVAPIFAV